MEILPLSVVSVQSAIMVVQKGSTAKLVILIIAMAVSKNCGMPILRRAIK